MIKDISGCCFLAALRAAVKAGGGEIEKQASPTELRMWVSFATVRGFQGFVTVDLRICMAVLLRRGG